MKLKQANYFAIVMLLALASIGLIAQGRNEENTKKSLLRVGVYDSRAVAVAYAHSKMNDDVMKAKMAEREQAKADGDQAKLEELEAWGKAQQARRHLQGFGTAPVTDILVYMKDKLPEIAAKAGVDVIVSKWQIDYQHPDIDVVDVTLEIIQPFEPKEQALKWIEQLKAHPPLSQEVIEKHEH